MGKMKQHPRYNVISCRVTDAELAEIAAVVGNGNRAEFMLQAILDAVRFSARRKTTKAPASAHQVFCGDIHGGIESGRGGGR